ncbi:MAG TPA: flagellar biosynthesis protein FlhF [Bdellovibrionota bacterium]|jgi:flagellar biosynthesis protein FlhF
MQVKKFEAPTMQEALKVIKRELGPEAIILSTKHIKSGFGLMSKASVEVTAAIAEKDLKKKQAAEKNLPQEVKEKIWNSKATKQAEIYNDYFEKQLRKAGKDTVELGSKARKPAQQQPRTSPSASPAPEARPRPQAQATEQRAQAQTRSQAPSTSRERRYIDIGDDDSVSNTPAYARAPDKVKSLEADIEQLKSMVVELASGTATRENTRDEVEQELSDGLVKAMQDLVTAGVEKKLARQLVRNAAFELDPSQSDDEALIQEKVAEQLLSEIQVADLLSGVGASAGKSSSSVVALVGPTGVGKTTTIAKIASLAILEKKLRVGLINLDSYKVAAADQLATYAKIMNVPFRSVDSKEELNQAIYDFSSLDLVLIDTTGRSQKDQESLLQLRHILAGIEGARNVLMISATTKDSDINEVVGRFKIFRPIGLVFSKLDETSVYGCIYNAQKRCGLPMLYFTVGQRVPEDIEKASAERVVDLVLDL